MNKCQKDSIFTFSYEKKLKCVHQNQNSTYLKDIQYCKTIKGKERTPSLTAKRPNNRVTPSTVGKAQITFNPFLMKLL